MDNKADVWIAARHERDRKAGRRGKGVKEEGVGEIDRERKTEGSRRRERG